MISESNVVKFFRILLGATFILSAVAKIYSLDFFDELVAKQLIGEDYFDKLDKFYWVQWLTRVLIAGEFMLGVAVLQERHLKKIVLPSMIALLVVFTLQVIFEAEIHNKGYVGGNCGCFGEVIPLDNRETIIKNIILILLSAFVFWKYRPTRPMNLPPVLIPYVLGAVTLFTLSRTFNKSEHAEPVDMTQFEINTTKEAINTQANLAIDTAKLIVSNSKDSLVKESKLVKEDNKQITTTKIASIFDGYRNFSGGVYKDLEKGTHLICLFSFSCGHCQQAYRDILDARKSGAATGEIYVIGYGSEFDEKNFWKITGGKSPFIRIEDDIEFARLRQGADFPKIIAKDKGVTKKEWDYNSYSKESLFAYYGMKLFKDSKVPKPDDLIIDSKPQGSLIIDEKNSTPSIFDK